MIQNRKHGSNFKWSKARMATSLLLSLALTPWWLSNDTVEECQRAEPSWGHPGSPAVPH